MTPEFAHLTRNETCLARLDTVLQEQRPLAVDRWSFARGFVAGWQERGIAEPGMVTITRDYLAELERRSGIGAI